MVDASVSKTDEVTLVPVRSRPWVHNYKIKPLVNQRFSRGFSLLGSKRVANFDKTKDLNLKRNGIKKVQMQKALAPKIPNL